VLKIAADGVWAEAIASHGAWLAEQCLAVKVEKEPKEAQIAVTDDNGAVKVEVLKVS
jgi:hypothetical protein